MSGHVYLIGFMGAGKSTVGVTVAEALGRPFIDLDREIEMHEGSTIPEIFERAGEDGFRDAEFRALERVSEVPSAVVACGGGIVSDERSRGLLAAGGTVVYLEVSLEAVLERVDPDGSRPLLAEDRGVVANLLAARLRHYEEAADVVIRTDELDADGVASQVVRQVTDA